MTQTAIWGHNPFMIGDALGWLWFLVPLGVGVLALREYKVAKTCFALSGIVLGSKVLMEFHAHSSLPMGWKALIVFAVCGLVGSGVYWSWNWVDRKHAQDTVVETGNIHKAEIPTQAIPPIKEQTPKPKAPLSPIKLPLVPEVSISTNNGLTLSDFPDRVISAEMMRHMRRHSLLVKNPIPIDLENIVIRFQLPEPLVGSLVEDRPAGVEVIWHACRMSLSLSGDGASSTPSASGGIKITTGPSPGYSAALSGGNEVCSAAMNGSNLPPTGIYQLKISRLPAVTSIRMAFLTSNEPGQYMDAIKGLSSKTDLTYYSDGRFQYVVNNHTETKDVFIPMQFDGQHRIISSSPISGEHGKWKVTLMRNM